MDVEQTISRLLHGSNKPQRYVLDSQLFAVLMVGDSDHFDKVNRSTSGPKTVRQHNPLPLPLSQRTLKQCTLSQNITTKANPLSHRLLQHISLRMSHPHLLLVCTYIFTP